jgi:adenine-specific DNA-methyltransferase
MVELLWDGKYTEDHKRIGPIRIELPFQTVEIIQTDPCYHNKKNIPQDAQTQWYNRLIWGDKKYVLPSLCKEFSSSVKLIYIDPPFTTSMSSPQAAIPETNKKLRKYPNPIEQKMFEEMQAHWPDKYLQWFYETVILLKELLTDDGSIYIHCDWRLNYLLRSIMDEVFGASNFRNEIVWVKNSLGAKGKALQYPRNQDTILFYTKSDTYTFKRQTKIKKEFIEIINGKERLPKGYKQDEAGNYYWTSPKGDYSETSVANLRTKKRIQESSTGNIRIKNYVERQGNQLIRSSIVDDIWDDIQVVFRSRDTNFGYSTQKPEALLERIIQTSSEEDDIVLDCFCGSGTTIAVAEKLQRRWIACDIGRFAIHTTRNRLLRQKGVRPFLIQNIEKYERQAWQTAELSRGQVEKEAETQIQYRHFILKLYHAQSLQGYTWLHGVRNKHLVHVGSIDSPIAQGDISAILQEAQQINPNKKQDIDLLGWDFAFEINEVAKQWGKEANITLHFKYIPRDLLDQKIKQLTNYGGTKSQDSLRAKIRQNSAVQKHPADDFRYTCAGV